MAREFNKVLLLTTALAITILAPRSTAQTRHVVGDALGWLVPPNGAAAYSNWAANQTFTIGDILVFNFASGRHDVAEVTTTSFNACNTTNPLSRQTNSPANITLTTSGNHYYICTFPGHCNGGQKLAINVNAPASSPAPQPSSPAPQGPQPSTPAPVSAPTPTPASTPAPTPTPTSAPTPTPTPTSAPTPTPTSTPAPSRQPVNYTVGDSMGWTIPPNASVSYQIWARNKNFNVGDMLVFNYINGTHDVAETTKSEYDSCSSSNTLSLFTNPPTRITLTRPGEYYFICTFPSHCSMGQKLAINVRGSSGTAPTTPPSSAPTPTSSTATPPSPSTTTPTPPSPAGVTAPPPPNSSAKSLGVAGLFTTFFAIVVGLLY